MHRHDAFAKSQPARRGRPWRLTALAALLPILMTACDREQPVTPIEEGISFSLAEGRKASLSDLRYRFSLRVPDDAREPVTGRAVIHFRWRDPASGPVVLDFKSPRERIRGIRVNDEEVKGVFESDHVVLPASALRADAENRVLIEFAAGDDALNRNDEFLYTLFVPDRAHFSLPLFDQPDLKARVAWELTLPAGWTAIANGPETGRSGGDTDEPDGPGGRISLVFAESEPLPTYLFAFAAGRFEVVREERNGRTMEMLHRDTDADRLARNRGAIFDLHAAALAWLEEYTGIEYPFRKFGFVLIPSFQYGGMEHPGAITYRASSLLLEPSATQDQLMSRASLIAHETAHMWFGDLVTMAWFDDVWTKEVFANFMAAKIVHPAFPEVDHDLRFLLAHQPRAYAVDRSRGANPIRQPLDNLDEAGALYGPIIYQKAPVVMKQLERMMGEEALRSGLRTYLSRYAYGNATWPQLIDILDPLYDADLKAWSRVWVEEPGRPTVTVGRAGADANPGGRAAGGEVFSVRQSDPRARGRVWPQRLTLQAWDIGVDGIPMLSAHEEQSLGNDTLEFRPAPAAEGSRRLVVANGAGVEYGLFQPDSRSLDLMLSAGCNLRQPVVRGAVWLTLWDAMLEGDIGPNDLLSTGLEALPEEPQEQLVTRMLRDMSQAFWRFLPPESRTEFGPTLEGAIWSAMEASTSHTRRATLFESYVDIATSPEATARLARLWSGEEQVDGLALSEKDRIGLARALALREADGWREILESQAAQIDNPDKLAEFRFLLPSLDADTGVRATFFESLRDPANRAREPWVLEGLDNLHHPLRAADSVRFIQPSLEMLQDIQRTGDIFFPAGWMAATLSGHNTPEVVDIVDGFLLARPAYPARLAEKILQALDMVERAADAVYGTAGPFDD
jgi:aminopeptidase N